MTDPKSAISRAMFRDAMRGASGEKMEIEMTASERAAVLFAKTQAEHSGKPQSEVNAIVRDAIVNIQAKDVTP